MNLTDTCSDVFLFSLQETEKRAVLPLLLPAPRLFADVLVKTSPQRHEPTAADSCGNKTATPSEALWTRQ